MSDGMSQMPRLFGRGAAQECSLRGRMMLNMRFLVLWGGLMTRS